MRANGSIPARAGKPVSARRPGRRSGVYPRTRGETNRSDGVPARYRGLSPHARGNRQEHLLPGPLAGSIPARAGKPRRGEAKMARYRVYPRTRGETSGCFPAASCRSGLSPHARGNQSVRFKVFLLCGSIPARAGKPTVNRSSMGASRVYPRTRGETPSAARGLVSAGGLSPHARGNRLRVALALGAAGSIPARAGKPIPFVCYISG